MQQGKISRCCLLAGPRLCRACLETGFPALNPANLQQRRRTRHDVVFGMQARCHGICRSRALLRMSLEKFCSPLLVGRSSEETGLLVWRPARQPRLFRPGVVWEWTVYPETNMTLSSQAKKSTGRRPWKRIIQIGRISRKTLPASPGPVLPLDPRAGPKSVTTAVGPQLEAVQDVGRRPASSCVAGWGDACGGHACMRDGSTFVSLVLAACHLAR